jgi:hypothetical protein
MHDFAEWVEAAAPMESETAAPMESESPAMGWRRGRFTPIYARNRDEATDSVLESSIVAQLVLRLLEAESNHWEGEPHELLERLREMAGPSARASRTYRAGSRTSWTVWRRRSRGWACAAVARR